MAVVVICNASAPGQEPRSEQAKSLLFDIPAQPLREALFAYTALTGLSVLVDEAVTLGRRSAPVKGNFVSEDALKTLLTGTGLEFQYTVTNAFTLIPVAAVALAGAPRDNSRDEVYFRAIQTVVKNVICSHVQTVPGQYRVVVQLWIDGSGVVLRSALLDSTGSGDRDQQLSGMLDGLSVGEPPPVTLPQPVTLVILPRSPRETKDCGPAGDRAPPKVRG